MSDVFDDSRSSQDSDIHAFGKSLLSLCLSCDLSIVNGNAVGDSHGKFTYISVQGTSVVDYLILSIAVRSYCEASVVRETALSSHVSRIQPLV